ncbi:MAG: transposase [Ardenticatenaceae bacterium]|nr:transposase [Ardenticatenaceae bacterium]
MTQTFDCGDTTYFFPRWNRSKGGWSFGTNIHIAVDALGNPLKFILTGDQRHDVTQARALPEPYAFDRAIADKGYDADRVFPKSKKESQIVKVVVTKQTTTQKRFSCTILH